MEIKFPALYDDANNASNSEQSAFLRLIKFEYLVLFIAAILALRLSDSQAYMGIYAFVFIVAAGLLLYRVSTKPEQGWYRCRALAESLKTSTWRYMMRADPFEDAQSIEIPRANFRNHLSAILEANKFIGEKIAESSSPNDQVTDEMETIRRQNLRDRIGYYCEHRIDDQRSWYATKASWNKTQHKIWIAIILLLYLTALGSVIYQIVTPEVSYPFTEPLIVLASALLGWVQIKKFNELSASYLLTAHEIGIIKSRAGEIDDEDDFSEFVNEAELAFSREHTQWVARQQHD